MFCWKKGDRIFIFGRGAGVDIMILEGDRGGVADNDVGVVERSESG